MTFHISIKKVFHNTKASLVNKFCRKCFLSMRLFKPKGLLGPAWWRNKKWIWARRQRQRAKESGILRADYLSTCTVQWITSNLQDNQQDFNIIGIYQQYSVDNPPASLSDSSGKVTEFVIVQNSLMLIGK